MKAILSGACFIATLIISPPSHALEVGATLHFKSPVAGCTFYGDAREVLRLRTLGNSRGAQAYMDSLAIDRDFAIVRAARPDLPPLYVDGKIRVCMWLGPSGGSASSLMDEYTVIRKSPAETTVVKNSLAEPAHRAVPLPPGHTESDPFPMAWFCVVPVYTYDISHHEPGEKREPEPDPKTYCTWVFLSDTTPAAARLEQNFE
jgi:hypothetical protein